MQLKLRHYLVKQKARPNSLHRYEDVGPECVKLIKAGRKKKSVDVYCFVSPVVKTVKNDNSLKIAFNSLEKKDYYIKRRPHTNIDELLNQTSVEITRDRAAQLFI